MARSLLVRSLVFALPWMVLVGCGHQRAGGPEKDIPFTPGQEPASVAGKYGGRFVQANISDPKTFNYWVAGETSSTDILGPLYEPLIQRNMYTLKFEPRLAASMPTISADGLTYTFHLRPGLKWSDGAPITADDVIFTLDVIFDPTTETIMREGMLIDVTQPNGTSTRQKFAYKKIDDLTVEFRLPQSYAPALDTFGFPIAPRHKLESAYKGHTFNSAYSIDTDPAELVASGAWQMSSYTRSQEVTYKRNPYFWRRGVDNKVLPYLDTYTYEIVPDLNTLTLKFKSGDTDSLAVPANSYSEVKRAQSGSNYKMYSTGPGFGFQYLCFNMNPNAKVDPNLRALFSDVRFRQAVSYAMNRQRMIDSIYEGLGQPAYGPLSPANTEFYNPNIPKTEYNLDKARQLLAEAGLTQKNANGMLLYHGKEVKFTILTNGENPIRKSMCAIMTEDLHNLGLNASYAAINFNKLVEDIDTRPYQWEAVVLGFTGDVDPIGGANVWRSSGPSHQWWPKQATPATPWEAQIDKIWIQAEHEMNPAKRKALYDQWQVIAAQQLPFIYTVVPESHIAVRNHLGNIKPTGLGGSTWNLEEQFDRNATRLTP